MVDSGRVDSGLRILVIGAGIAGLAVTRALRLAGFTPDVVEKESASTIPGSGMFLPGNGARALRLLDLHEAVRPLGTVITGQRVLTPGGTTLAEIDAAQLWGAVGECRGLPRADLHRVLLAGAGADIRFGTAVSGVEIVGDTAKVTFAGGGGDGDSAEYDLVIAADGRRSAVRAMAGLGGPARPVGQVAYRAVVEAGQRDAPDAWTLLLGGGTSLLALPVGDGRTYLYADETTTESSPPAGDAAVDRVRQLFAGYGGPAPALLRHVERVQVARLEEVDLPAWVRGPVALIGDSAHATAPALAQGAALALEDAVALAEELTRTRDVASALDAYQRRRRPRAAWLLAQTHGRDRLRRLPAVLRHTALRIRGEAIFRANYGPLMGAP